MRNDTRERVKRHREKQKLIGNDTVTLHETSCNALRKKNKKEEEDKEKEIIPYVEIVTYLNEKTGKNYRSSSKATQKWIMARWNEGFRVNDFKQVIDIKVRQWLKDGRMSSYLRPETLFGTKFESYLNETEVTQNEQSSNSYAKYNFDQELTPSF